MTGKVTFQTAEEIFSASVLEEIHSEPGCFWIWVLQDVFLRCRTRGGSHLQLCWSMSVPVRSTTSETQLPSGKESESEGAVLFF